MSTATIAPLATSTSRPVATVAPPSPTPAPPNPTAVPPPAATRLPTIASKPSAEGRFDPRRVIVGAERVAGGFNQPLYVTSIPDGSGRLAVLEKVGRVRLLDGTLFLDVTDRVTAPPLFSYEREQGLLGLAFHPRFAENGFFYVHYNDRRGNHVISRFGLRGGLGDPASEKVLLRQNQPETNFNGGQLLFGPDGFLYLGLGTGGTKKELQDGAQDPGSLLGKIVRVDVDGGDPYAIPPDNPFVGRRGARPEVWAYGLRNPWRFSFDRTTGDLYIGGPGEFKREWINFLPAGSPPGANFGWPVIEGTLCWRQPNCDTRGLRLPILEYNTYEGGNCVVIGGYVYRGQRYPALRGVYLYGDFCSGRVYAAWRDQAGTWSSVEVYRLGALLSSFGEDESGEVYVTDIQNGVVHRLTARAREN